MITVIDNLSWLDAQWKCIEEYGTSLATKTDIINSTMSLYVGLYFKPEHSPSSGLHVGALIQVNDTWILQEESDDTCRQWQWIMSDSTCGCDDPCFDGYQSPIQTDLDDNTVYGTILFNNTLIATPSSLSHESVEILCNSMSHVNASV